MEKSTLIKLRQLEASNVTQNGDYNVSLKEGVILEEGDVVRLHTVILDTSTESFITLEDDTPITMEVGNYVRNYKINNPITQHFQITINDSQPDLNMYFPCFETGVSGDQHIIEKVVVYAKGDDRTDPITLEYSYIDPVTLEKATDTVFVPSFKGIDHYSLGFRVTINKLISGTSVTLLNTTSDLHSHKIADGKGMQPRPFFIVSTDPLPNPGGNEVVNNIFTRTLSFTIPAGRYYPAEIATIINDEMSILDASGPIGYKIADNAYPVNNPFMQTLHQINYLVTGSTPAGLDKLLNYNPTRINDQEFPTTLFTYDTSVITTSTEDPVIGANEVSLNYDDTLKKLNFDALHFPFYVGGTATGGGQPGTVYPADGLFLQPKTADVPVPKEPQTNYGGAFFTKLTPPDFWTRQLGFENITVSPGQSVSLLSGRKKADNTDLPDIYPLTLNLTPGVNIVTAYNGLDNIIPKTDTAYLPKLDSVSTALTTPIISSREFDVPHNSEGYYLIEVGMNLPQKMIGGDSDGRSTSSNKVQAIMGKYFTAGNFLQSQGQGTIVYEHIGEPALLQNLGVQIRNPDMTLTSLNDLGDKNSVFLEVVKTVAQPAKPN